MFSQTLVSALLVLVFIVVGGVFAATEIALISLRESQLAQLERRGPRGARVAQVARDPNRFLAAVQIGVTVAGFLSAAYGGATLAPDLAPHLEHVGLSEGAAETAALVALTLVIAYSCWCSASWPRSGSRCRSRPASRCWWRRCWTGSPA
ncbi:MAG: CNNM domain-containing protein [Nocardioides sp.]